MTTRKQLYTFDHQRAAGELALTSTCRAPKNCSDTAKHWVTSHRKVYNYFVIQTANLNG